MAHLMEWMAIMKDLPLNMALRLSCVTGVSAVDKNGLLATSQPILEKIFFVTTSNDDVTGQVLHLSGNTVSSLSFDDSLWYRFLPNIWPLIESTRVNTCTADSVSSNCICAIRHLVEINGSDNTAHSSFAFNLFSDEIAEESQNSRTLRGQCTIQYGENESLLHCRAPPSLLLPLCHSVWDGTEVRDHSDKILRLSSDFALRHSTTGHCCAISCAAVSNHSMAAPVKTMIEWKSMDGIPMKVNGLGRAISDLNLSHDIDMDQMDKMPQTLIGLTSSNEQALPSIFEMIESLQSSCIRFILFSTENELRSRLMGEKLGLEVGWNCHISLKNETSEAANATSSYSRIGRRKSCPDLSSAHSIPPHSQPIIPPNMARLPTGIEQVRPHLEEVDNVPLLVSLFTDCTAESTREMIDILQEQQESQLVIGSSFSNDNLLTFMKGAFSIGVHPLKVSGCKCSNSNEDETPLPSLAADLLIHQSQMVNLPLVLSFARRRSSLIAQSLSFYLISSISLSLHFLISPLLLLPFPISSFNMIVLCFIIHPLVTLSISMSDDATSRHANPTSYLSVYGHPTLHFIAFHFPHLVTLQFTYIFMLSINDHLPCGQPLIFEWMESLNSHATITQLQHIISFLRTLTLILTSVPYIFPFENSYRKLPFISPEWSITVLFSLLLQFYLSPECIFTSISPIVFVFYIILSTISIGIAQSYKKANIRVFRKENRRRKFGFDTKLGMNSPY
ncbi:hypothetical protein PFISCL1PPCAC_19870 [Pristionchus fissidentatus]|uniref:G protein-coupled receptor n=1 Tax=Pristionchus fissidentatus TaxID=1538716 RepID=A0AAV5WDZ1_9BILA|nr:hypothetical protein PFISCL1PPCAC_19870 [Pristionchus fissidentatus]